MPAYAVQIANILNGVSNISEKKYSAVKFTAPEARILIVDDIVTNLTVAKGLLAPYQIPIDCCTGGLEAIRLVEENRYDLVLMDHLMPGMDGVKTVKAIRELPAEHLRSLPIIALTANAMSGIREMFLENGFNDYLSKPIELNKLDEILREWIPEAKKKQASPAAAAAVEEWTGMGIDGVDVAKGILMTGGTEAAYRKVLASFLKDALARLPMLENPPAETELSSFTNTAHALKSTTATIGAAAVSAEAAELEKAGRAGDLGFIKKQLPAFYRDLQKLAGHIGPALDAKAAAETGSEEAVTRFLPLFLELRAALEQEHPETIHRITTELEQKTFDAKTGSLINSISDSILMAEFEEAIKSIDALVGAKNSGG
jgi:CheY-like chemotaxis protein